METFGERVRRLRETRGLSRSDVASRIGGAAQAIAAWENGENKQPGFIVGLKLARVLGVSPEELAFGERGSLSYLVADLDGNLTPQDDRDARLRALEEAVHTLAGLPDEIRQVVSRTREIEERLASSSIAPPEQATQR